MPAWSWRQQVNAVFRCEITSSVSSSGIVDSQQSSAPHANAEELFFWRANIVYIARTIIERSADTCLMSSRQPVRVGARLE
ncbi:TPA: hypothetical protein MJC42_02505 [Klebsiella pneumoniae]|nr:hypothetical protein [Klebsiella pneumoniae]